MGTVYPEIDERLREWIGEQSLFFVGTAPSGSDGHVNISPKGTQGTFAVLGPREVAYVDLFGSGIETVAHLKDNGRIVIMFCAFTGPPKIIRLHGNGEVVEQSSPVFSTLRERFAVADEASVAVRSIVRVDVSRVADSCGFAVPLMSYEGDRDQLIRYARSHTRKHGPDAIRDYCDVNNDASIDGLPGLVPFDSPGSGERRAHDHRGRKL